MNSAAKMPGLGGVLGELTRRLSTQALEAKPSARLGYERHQEPSGAIVYLDAMIVKVREGNIVRNHAYYRSTAIGVSTASGRYSAPGFSRPRARSSGYSPDRAQAPRSAGHPVLLHRRPPGLPGRNRVVVPGHGRPGLCRSPTYTQLTRKIWHPHLIHGTCRRAAKKNPVTMASPSTALRCWPVRDSSTNSSNAYGSK